MIATTKACTKCKTEKPMEEFHARRESKSGRCSLCKVCMRANVKRWLRTPNGKRRHRHHGLKKNYGITLEDYERMLAEQKGVCAICGTTESGGRSDNFHVDHCHATGNVRGLLCVNCNRGIGHFNDDPTLLEAAAAYLRPRPQG